MVLVKNALEKTGDPRTFKNCRINYFEWCKAGSKKENAKKFFSCINPVIVSGSDSSEVIDILTPPELHLMIGIVNHIVSSFINECNSDAAKWIKACNVHVDKRNGSASFNGNACRTLLKKANYLRNSKAAFIAARAMNAA